MNLTPRSPRLRRRIGALVFAGLLPLALASCSDDNGDASETVAEDSNTSTASSEASEQEGSETTESSEEFSESKKRKPNPTLGSSTPEQDAHESSKSPEEPVKGECIWPDVDHATYQPGTDNLVSKYCDGRWAIVGRYGSGGLALYKFDGAEWKLVPQDSEYDSGFGPCYTERYLRELGVPNVVLTEGPNCSG